MDCVRSLKFDSEEFDEEEYHLDSSSGCEVSMETSGNSFTYSSPIRSSSPYAKQGDDRDSDMEELLKTPLPKITVSCSPPSNGIRALRLFGSPATPKTMLRNSEACATPAPRRRYSHFYKKPSSYPKREKPSANVNPFTPDAMLLSKKRTRLARSPVATLPTTTLNFDDHSDTSDVEIEQPTKRLALEESNISRYHQEFVELELIGSGQFGLVYKCKNRLDGCIYAVKKSTKPVASSVLEKQAMNEVYAHAVLDRHQHVVRYYSAWSEDNHIIIQNEYCKGGSLADKIARDGCLNVQEIHQLILHIAEGLRYIHSENLVHLDIKPGNILIAQEKKFQYTCYDSTDDGFEEVDETSMHEEEQIIYKIGDLGHVTSLISPQVEEGDCRYLPKEILNDDYSHLPKADIFAFGLTVLEAAGSGPLPKNGEQWHRIREGHIPPLKLNLNPDLVELLKSMIGLNPASRPTPVQILQHRAVRLNRKKSDIQTNRELNAMKLKNEILSKQLVEATKCIKSIAGEKKLPSNSNNKGVSRLASRLIGKKNRSFSTTTF